MDRRIAPEPARRMLGAAAGFAAPAFAATAFAAKVLAAITALAVVPASGVVAQTLTEPNPRTQGSPSTVTAKSRTAKSRPIAHLKNCSAYGAGFVNVPGTDACIKIGGSMTVEAGH